MKTSTLLLTCLLFAALTKAQPNSKIPKLELEPFATGLLYPMDIANCGDRRLFVAERLGKIWILDTLGHKNAEPFLDITDKVFTVFPNDYDERGLLGLTFHPNYPDSPYLYVNYIGHDSDSHIVRYTADPNNAGKALKNSALMLLTVQQPKGVDFINHKGGCLKFGPDGYLYGTFGDGGSADDPLNNAQNTRILLGKMIRIDVNHKDASTGKNYSIPPDNPFVNKAKVKDEIWATGLRNPTRFSFDKANGNLWLADVGQDKWEEINLDQAGGKGGRNYGWSCYEGTHNFKINGCDYNGMPYTFPIVEYGHTESPCAAITGGFVYRGTKYKNMQGKYFYCDYCTGKFSMVFRNTQTWINMFLLDEDDLEYSAFGEDSKGELYSVNTVTGEIEHLIDESVGAKNPVAGNEAIVKSLGVKLYPNPNHGQFSIEINAVQNEQYRISVSNIYGNEVYTETRQAVKGINRWSMASPQFKKGVYMLNVQTTKGTVSQKFVVE